MDPKPDYLNSLEQSGKYIAELKWNGDNALIYTDDMSFWGRRGQRLRYNPIPEVVEELKKFPKGCIINAEVVHYHTKTVKDQIIVHCLMAWKGLPMIGKTWGDSRKILETLTYGKHIVLSEIFRTGFWTQWQKTDGELIEGIILKDPSGKLKFSTTPIENVPWMMKIRKPCKKYQF